MVPLGIRSKVLLSPVLGRVASQRNPDCRFREMNRSQSYKGRTGRPWLSQRFAGAALPALAVAAAVSQVNIQHDKKDVLQRVQARIRHKRSPYGYPHLFRFKLELASAPR
jgi:hypothetical protein